MAFEKLNIITRISVAEALIKDSCSLIVYKQKYLEAGFRDCQCLLTRPVLCIISAIISKISEYMVLFFVVAFCCFSALCFLLCHYIVLG